MIQGSRTLPWELVPIPGVANLGNEYFGMEHAELVPVVDLSICRPRCLLTSPWRKDSQYWGIGITKEHVKHKFMDLVEKEHLRLHTGPTLVAAPLAQKFHILGSHRIICAVMHGCISCRSVAGQPHNRLNPGLVFNKVWVDYTWLLTRTKKIHQGLDGKVHVVTLRTAKEAYTCPVVAIAFDHTSDNP